jgi:chitodextrinase
MKRLALPIALISALLSCQPSHAQVTATTVRLTWTAAGDDSLTGLASSYDLRYSTGAITTANFAAATRWLAIPALAAPGTVQSATVTGLTPSTSYWFAIKTADEVPNWSGISNVIVRTTLAPPDTTPPAAIRDLGYLPRLPAIMCMVHWP